MESYWTADRISLLTNSELANLHENSFERKNNRICSLCLEELSRRKTSTQKVRLIANGKSVNNKSVSSLHRKLEREADELLVSLANKVNVQFDLSDETARKLSGKPFRYHRLLAKNGRESKIGGVKKRGEVLAYRFISYRINQDVVSVAAMLVDEDCDKIDWVVGAPDRLLPDQKDQKIGSEIIRGMWCSQFLDAQVLFEKVLHMIAPKKFIKSP